MSNKYLSKINYTYLTTSCLLPLASCLLPFAFCLSSLGNLFCSTTYSLLKNEKDLTETQNIKLEAIKENFPNLKKMHELKEEFRKIYETSENPTEGLLSISEWLAKSSSVFTKSCQTIRNWFGEIISYFERRTTNGVVEVINNKLKLIKRRGYGFRNFRNFWVRSMLFWQLVC
jgi:transposase